MLREGVHLPVLAFGVVSLRRRFSSAVAAAGTVVTGWVGPIVSQEG